MNVKEVIIKEIDLTKLMSNKGIKNIPQLAKISGVPESYIYRCQKGKLTMSQYIWDKIKICL